MRSVPRERRGGQTTEGSARVGDRAAEVAATAEERPDVIDVARLGRSKAAVNLRTSSSWLD